MRKKMLLELFVYVLVVIIGLILLFTYKPNQKPVDIPSDFKIVRGGNNAVIHGK
jgi:quinol-cytochrome oxidoreductase complex cytochrome b subunit